MRNTITKTTIESWCMKNGFTLDWHSRKVNNIPFILAEGDLYLNVSDEPSPAFTEEKFVALVKK